MASVAREATERGEPMAIGLVRMIRSHNFVASLYLFCDILPHICWLSLVFQQQNVDLTVIQSQVAAVVDYVSVYENSPTPSLSKLAADLCTGSLKHLEVTVTPEKEAGFFTNIQQMYIIALKKHLENRLPSTELLDASSQQKEVNSPRLQDLYCLNNHAIVEDGVRAE